MRRGLVGVLCWLSFAFVMLWSGRSHAGDGDGPKLRFYPGSADASIYVRADTDRTTVVSPRAHLRKGVITDRTNLDVVYTADVWTSASIDVRTAATGQITEQRDEVVIGLDHEQGIVSFGAGYRFSREYDYLSNGGNLFLKVDAFKRTATFETRVSASFDHVGRAGDEYFHETQRTLGAWFGYTQVLNPKLLMQIAYEVRGTFGYQASPYRFVSIGGNGTCATAGAVCIPEALPDLRVKHAGVARVRAAVTDKVSIGGAYRFYMDDWRVQSHTAIVDLGVLATRRVTVGVEYRPYTQTAAGFYRRSYSAATDRGFFTRDRELSPLHNHRLNARVQYARAFGQRHNELNLGALVGGTVYSYRNFNGLSRVGGLEVSTSIGVGF